MPRIWPSQLCGPTSFSSQLSSLLLSKIFIKISCKIFNWFVNFNWFRSILVDYVKFLTISANFGQLIGSIIGWFLNGSGCLKKKSLNSLVNSSIYSNIIWSQFLGQVFFYFVLVCVRARIRVKCRHKPRHRGRGSVQGLDSSP